MSDGHYIDKCKHGVTIRQCRCPGGTVTIVPCPEYHNSPDYKPGDPWPTTEPPLFVRVIYRDQGLMPAIKALREHTPGLGLVEAKRQLDAWLQKR